MEYSVSAQGYFARARTALLSDLPESLFYAAFELRCCIETRQDDYAQALTEFSNTKIKPWNIRDTGKKIRRASFADKIVLMRYEFDEFALDTFHTPVSDELIAFSDKFLGQLLHCQSKYRPPDHKWWNDTKSQLIEGYRITWLACQGDSLVPPLYDKVSKQLHPMKIERNLVNSILYDRFDDLVEKRFKFTIDYLESPPPHWQCDL